MVLHIMIGLFVGHMKYIKCYYVKKTNNNLCKQIDYRGIRAT